MLMSDFLVSRRSIRSYKNKKVDKKDLKELNNIIADANTISSDFYFTIEEDAKKVYESLDGSAGYGGVMIKAPIYLALRVKNEDIKTYIESSFYFEKLITELKGLSLGSCWVTLTNVAKEKLEEAMDNGGEVKFLLAAGYPERDFSFGEKPFSSKIGTDELVFNESIGNKISEDELESLGLLDLFYYLRFAPSSYNKQPVRFIIKKDGIIEAYLENADNNDGYVDAGIMLYYFEELAKTIGLREKWDIEPKKISESLVYIGKIGM